MSIFLLHRISDIADIFANVVLVSEKSYNVCLSITNYKISVRNLCKGGSQMYTKKRNMNMYQFGGTIGASRYPKFRRIIFGGKKKVLKYSMLPRPVVKSRPGQFGHTILNNTPWIKELVGDISKAVNDYLLDAKTVMNSKCLQEIRQSVDIIPSCLRICNSFFTQMIILCSKKGKDCCVIPTHIDEDDVVNAILTLGDISNGEGSTVYYDGITSKETGNEYVSIPFKHGRLQIGFFDQVYHGVTPWKGDRVSLSFSLQRKLQNHFVKFGSQYYDQFVKNGYPSKEFIAR